MPNSIVPGSNFITSDQLITPQVSQTPGGIGNVDNANHLITNPYSGTDRSTNNPYQANAGTIGDTYALPYTGNIDFNRFESKNDQVSQAATNVWRGAQYQLPQEIGNYSGATQNFLRGNYNPNLTNVNLGTNFQGGNSLNRALRGGIDYFGNLGISQGIQNINAQQNTANQALSNQLSRNPGNAGLLSVLQNQNRLRSQLAINPLITQAQQGTYDRAGNNINLNNQQLQLQNSAQQAQAGFNNQNQLQSFQSRLAALQPTQNLLELLTSLQGQARGIASEEGSFAGKNYS